MVRTADVKRGWGKFFNKSCKAKEQEKRTGQMKNYLKRRDNQATTFSSNFLPYNGDVEVYDDLFDIDEMDGHFSNEGN
ncbi:MAG: hypothetical protein GY810_01245 [Aureispira sp.]|nr:hypothetical protein [Aureispira sp.]